MALLSVAFLLAAVLLAAWKPLRRGWQEEPPSARRVWFRGNNSARRLSGAQYFHRWLRRKLEGNPIGWLEQRNWTGRLVTWGWFAVLVSFYSVNFLRANIVSNAACGAKFHGLEPPAAVSAVKAQPAASQRERETRVLELLLVSPMTAGQKSLSGGCAVYGASFCRHLLLMVTVWFYLGIVLHNNWRPAIPLLLPLFLLQRLFLAFRSSDFITRWKRSNFISSFLTTLAVGLLVPQMLREWVGGWLWWFYLHAKQWDAVILIGGLLLPVADLPSLIFQAAIGLWLGWKLRQNLVNR